MPEIDRDTLRARAEPAGLLNVRVTPNARSERIAFGDEGIVRVWVTVPPEDGKANKAVIKLLAKWLGLPKSALDVERGETSRTKVIRVRF